MTLVVAYGAAVAGAVEALEKACGSVNAATIVGAA